MAEFWSDEWFGAVNAAASKLPAVDDLSFSFDVEVAESEHGKVRAHGRVSNGQLEAFSNGKFVPENKGEKADVSFVVKAKRLMPVITGERPALVAYMLGELKVDGAYELVVDRFANEGDREALEAFRTAVATATATAT